MKETFLLEGFSISSPRGFLGWSNALLLEDDQRRIVVDTGGSGDRGTLVRRMQSLEFDPLTVDTLILTHLHFDHCLNLDLFPRAKILLTTVEREYVASKAYRRQQDMAVPPFVLCLLDARDLLLVDGEMDAAAGVRLVPTPGHTPGGLSVVYSADDQPTAACGDLVKNAQEFLDEPPSSVGRVSLARVRQLAGRFIPGHDRPFTTDGATIRYEGRRELEVTVMTSHRCPATTSWRFD